LRRFRIRLTGVHASQISTFACEGKGRKSPRPQDFTRDASSQGERRQPGMKCVYLASFSSTGEYSLFTSEHVAREGKGQVSLQTLTPAMPSLEEGGASQV
jgi:hypothetical protein